MTTAIAAANSTIGPMTAVNFVAFIAASKLFRFSCSNRLNSYVSRAKERITRAPEITSCKNAVISAVLPCTSWPAERNFLPNILVNPNTTGTIINVKRDSFQSK